MSQIALLGMDADLAIERRLERCMDPAFRHAIQVICAQRHVNDIESLSTGFADNLTRQPERGQNSMRVIVGSPADESDHADHRVGVESIGTQPKRGPTGHIDFIAGDEQFHFPSAGRPGLKVAFDQPDTDRFNQFAECGHALA